MAEKKTCFVICPIGSEGSAKREHSDLVLKHIISPVLDPLKFKPIRADELPLPGIITNQIIDLLIEAPLVIADLTDENPNVYYELAVRHAVGKPCVHMIKADQSIPFDNSGVRAIPYGVRVDQAERAREELRNQIQSVTGEEHKSDNPIIAAKRYSELLKKINSTENADSKELFRDMAESFQHFMNEVRSEINQLKQVNTERNAQKSETDRMKYLRDKLAQSDFEIAINEAELKKLQDRLKREPPLPEEEQTRIKRRMKVLQQHLHRLNVDFDRIVFEDI